MVAALVKIISFYFDRQAERNGGFQPTIAIDQQS
jgi:hypothetical protein